jgi:Ca2+-binding EF-hand superfamily protein
MDLNDSGQIDAGMVRRMLESRGFSVSGKEVNDLMHKFDTSKSGKINYAEFRDEILPKSPVKH